MEPGIRGEPRMICHELQVSDAYTRSDEMLRMIKFLAAVLAVSTMATASPDGE